MVQARVEKLPKISSFFGYISGDSSSQEVEQQDPEELQEDVIPRTQDHPNYNR